MDERTLIQRMRRSAAAFWGMQAANSPGGSAFVKGGITASITPAVPNPPFFNFFNALFYEDHAAVEAVLNEVEAAYDAASVQRWMAWVLDRDDALREVLEARGFRLSGTNVAMARELTAELPALSPPSGVEVVTDVDIATYADVAERGFEVEHDAYRRGLAGLPLSKAHPYVAVRGGTAIACVMAFDFDRDCAINMVATVPAARLQGISRVLMTRALNDAVRRGATTSSLQASEAGYQVYQRLGFRPLGRLLLLERV